MRRAVLALLLVGCSDYTLDQREKPAPGDDTAAPCFGDIDVSPTAVDAGIVCGFTTATVAVTNRGGCPLRLEALTLRDGAWGLDLAAPVTEVAPGETVDLDLVGTAPGDLLVIESNDPDEPRVEVPIVATADAAPSITVTAPTSGDILPTTGDVSLTVQVSDDVDPPGSLAVAWQSDASGTVGAATPDSAGVATLAWTSGDRTAGDQLLTATVTDSCGNTASTDLAVCQQAGYDSDNLDLSSWTFAASASWDATNGWLELTPAGQYLVGSAFQTGAATTGDNVTIAFRFFVGNGTGADGFAVTALNIDEMGETLGSAGGCLGYGNGAGCEPRKPALPGWTIEVDTFYNADIDPTPDDHVAFLFDGDQGAVQAWAALPEMEDTGWHTMEITVAAPRVTVTVDGTAYIDQDIAGDYAFPAYVGFTAATGGSTNQHLIDALTVTEYVCAEE